MGRSARSSLLVPLAISTLFHLSMVTVFSISVWFEIEPVNYFSFHIVDRAAGAAVRREEIREQLSLPPIGDTIALPERTEGNGTLLSSSDEEPQTLTIAETDLFPNALPHIELPRLELAQLGDLRLRDERLNADARYEALNRRPRPDSWARFGEGLGRLRDAVSRLPFFARTQAASASRTQIVDLPLEGLTAHIEWLSEPKDRELLFAAPVQGLLHFHPGDLPEPLVLGFKVDADGTVTEVLTPVGDETGLIAGAGDALRQYRFEPTENGTPREQHATLTIAVEGTEP